MSELTKGIKVSTEVHQNTDDGRVHVTHMSIPSNPKETVIRFSFSMDVVSASVFAAQIQVMIKQIHTQHADMLTDKTLKCPTGQSHA